MASNPTKLAAALRGAGRRRQLNSRFAGIDEDPEAIYPAAVLDKQPPISEVAIGCSQPSTETGGRPRSSDPSNRSDPSDRSDRSALSTVTIAIADSVPIELLRIDAGQFIMGSDQGYPNERPAHPEVIGKPFLIGRFEVTNRRYQCFDPAHDSGLETGERYQFGDDERGFTLNRPQQPVVRVSWDCAMAFCEWFSAKTGYSFTLPTEAQWEYACRAGSSVPLWYGTLDDDFSRFANVSDATHHSVYYPHAPDALPPWRPADTRFNDHWRVSAPVGTFAPNPWGLCDMHGNVAEWTRSDYRPYGEAAKDGPRAGPGTRKVVRGGSWLDCPKRARSAFRLHYEASQAIHDVGFRVVCAIKNP